MIAMKFQVFGVRQQRSCVVYTSYGFGDSVFAWFASYLDGRTQHVRCGSSNSHPAVVKFGVPQDSVLGPILFLLYTADLLRLIEQQTCAHIYTLMTPRYMDSAGLAPQLSYKIV